ncbi:MAG: hypothetical protein K8R54_00165 [Bacteroidales bacterium]|nr:hypothetical protein [Bacteroidales bacterium]
MNNLEDILKKRFGGAVNIKGIDFQIIYSLYKALNLYDANCKYSFIRFEGIEDVDLIGFTTDNNYIQVKTSDKPWNWAKIREPFKNFAEVIPETQNSKFTLIFNFLTTKKIKELQNYSNLCIEEQKKLVEDTYKLCLKYKIKKDTIRLILNNLSIKSYSRNTLINEIKQKITTFYNLSSNIADFYFYALAYHCIEWSYERKTITKTDLDKINISISEGIERDKYFENYGKSLITKINWEIDKNPNDFYEAKRIRAGHIVANLDVKRNSWLDKINSAFLNNNICVIKAASGQGKSTLAYRYIYDNWDINFTYIIKSAQSKQDADSISDYLIDLSKRGLPINLLIDDVKEEIKYYSEILSTCAANGIKTLITIRNEDDYRFSNKNITNYEIITPYLDLTEAKEIFTNLKKQNKIVSNCKSPELAYEKLGKNTLLIEYIFLITQGNMLSDLLSEQIKIMQNNNESSKIEILRRITLANTLGTPVILPKLLELFSELINFQGIIESIVNEFITIDENMNYPNINIEKFIIKIIEYSKTKELRVWLEVTKGLFEGGEEFFFKKNKFVYDKVYNYFGNTLLFNSELFPVIKTNTVNNMLNIFIGEEAKGLDKIKEYTKEVENTNRGLDFVKLYLSYLVENVNISFVTNNIKEFGFLLDWLYICNLQLTKWNEIVNYLIKYNAAILDLNSFCIFSQGLYRYDNKNHKIWFNKSKNYILKYLKKKLEIHEIKIKHNTLNIKYINSKQEPNFNKETMDRLNLLRSAIPFCDKYCGSEINCDIIIKNSNYDYNPSKKEIPKDNLYFKTDTEKNSYLSKLTNKYYNPETWHEFQQRYYDLRIKLTEAINKVIMVNQGKISKIKFQVYLDNNLTKLSDLLKFRPDETPTEINSEFKELFKEAKSCFTSIHNTVNFLFSAKLVENSHLIFTNYEDFMKRLDKMQLFFTKLNSIVVIAFDFESLNKKEDRIYNYFPKILNEIFKQR